MLYVYGPLMPFRVLEEIRFWKMQEREHTVVIRQITPMLESAYVALMQQWEGVFAQTEGTAEQWIETVVRSQPPISPYIIGRINELLDVSIIESREFVRQLFLLLEQSGPIRTNMFVKTVVLHIIRESEYFLGVLEAAAHQAPDPDVWRNPQPEVSAHAPDADADADAGERVQIHLLREEKPEGIDAIAAVEEQPEDLTATQEGVWSGIRPAPPAAKPVPIGEHKLPPLPYAYNALEPYIDAETMRLHHDKHHQSYVDGLNKAEKMLARARQTGDFDLIKHWEREAAFNGAGHYLHTIFWNVMKPGGGGRPAGAIGAEIKRSFGSFDAFHKQFSAAAEKVEGGGWAILVWSPRSHRLEILQAEKHQNLSQWDVIPLLPLDVWEHAYYLKYKNERAKYITAWWNVVNWDHVEERFVSARTLKWLPY